MAHFLLGLVFLADAVILHHRAGLPDLDATAPVSAGPSPATKVRLVGRAPLTLARLQLVATAVAVTLGTVVTSTGPHGGDPKARRFGFSLHSVAQLHGTSVEVLLGITILLLWCLARDRRAAGRHARRRDRAGGHGRPGRGRLHPVLQRGPRRPGRRPRRRGQRARRGGPALLPGPAPPPRPSRHRRRPPPPAPAPAPADALHA